MDHKEVSAKGGRKTMRKYGKKHFSKIGKRGAKAKLAKYGTEYFTNLSRLGVEARKKKALAKKGIIERVVEAVTS